MEKKGHGVPGRRDSTDIGRCVCPREAWSGRHIGGRSISVPYRPHPVPKLCSGAPWLNGLPHRWWSCRRRWLRKTRPWASWSRASASWRRPPLTAPSSGRSPMSPGAATSQPVAGPSASSPQVRAPQGRRPAGGGRLPRAWETSRARGQLPDCRAVSVCIRATLGARRWQAPRSATRSMGCLNRACLLPP